MRPHVVRRRKPVAIRGLFGDFLGNPRHSSELDGRHHLFLADSNRAECERRSRLFSVLRASSSVSVRDGVCSGVCYCISLSISYIVSLVFLICICLCL